MNIIEVFKTEGLAQQGFDEYKDDFKDYEIIEYEQKIKYSFEEVELGFIYYHQKLSKDWVAVKYSDFESMVIGVDELKEVELTKKQSLLSRMFKKFKANV